jgi:hypothetical protein
MTAIAMRVLMKSTTGTPKVTVEVTKATVISDLQLEMDLLSEVGKVQVQVEVTTSVSTAHRHSYFLLLCLNRQQKTFLTESLRQPHGHNAAANALHVLKINV